MKKKKTDCTFLVSTGSYLHADRNILIAYVNLSKVIKKKKTYPHDVRNVLNEYVTSNPLFIKTDILIFIHADNEYTRTYIMSVRVLRMLCPCYGCMITNVFRNTRGEKKKNKKKRHNRIKNILFEVWNRRITSHRNKLK